MEHNKALATDVRSSNCFVGLISLFLSLLSVSAITNYTANFTDWLTLKSNISANIYGPDSDVDLLGFIMSESITFSSPYLLRNSLAHSMPSWPRPPIYFHHPKITQTKWNHTRWKWYAQVIEGAKTRDEYPHTMEISGLRRTSDKGSRVSIRFIVVEIAVNAANQAGLPHRQFGERCYSLQHLFDAFDFYFADIYKKNFVQLTVFACDTEFDSKESTQLTDTPFYRWTTIWPINANLGNSDKPHSIHSS